MDTHGTKLYNLWRKQRALRRRLVLIGVIAISLFIWLRPHIFPERTSHDGGSLGTSSDSGTLTKGTPSYTTITSSGKTMEWTRVSPPNTSAVYAYTDTIAGIPITVSEQPLPKELQGDTESKLEDLAKNYGANRFITADATKVYIGTSVKGPQSIIFSKQSLLVLIKAASALNDEQWKLYIASLR